MSGHATPTSVSASSSRANLLAKEALASGVPGVTYTRSKASSSAASRRGLDPMMNRMSTLLLADGHAIDGPFTPLTGSTSPVVDVAALESREAFVPVHVVGAPVRVGLGGRGGRSRTRVNESSLDGSLFMTK